MNNLVGASVIGKGKFLQLLDRASWEFVDRPNVAGVVDLVALTGDEKIILVEQFRYSSNNWVIELPAGLIADEIQHIDETAKVAATRQLEEETGYQAGELVEVARGGSSPASSTENVMLFSCY